MDMVLTFSILSALLADLADGDCYWARLLWRRKPDDQAAGRSQPAEPQRGEGSSRYPRRRGDAAMPPRFAPEFDGIDCFETIVLN
ncbi:hypothetical protein GUJ93_ZPchr0006g43474 [Zizania palustris]|uniref:Secreted protein n=1 Tax=Zizania palustris TaxID=103762 RepID=A0A8J5W241_ZIZPA|nr:hypothetical protein GUJ93_ZPchr0006g43474 [Zizania palustris]